jgi:hypothetical protein
MPRSASAVNVDHSCNTTYITSSPIRKSKRKIRINDHLSSEETRAIKKSLAAVKEMRVNAKKIEQAEQATRHLLAVNRRKKEVERLLFQLESFSDPKELTQNQKDTKTTRQAVGFDLTSMQQSREQSDLELSSCHTTLPSRFYPLGIPRVVLDKQGSYSLVDALTIGDRWWHPFDGIGSVSFQHSDPTFQRFRHHHVIHVAIQFWQQFMPRHVPRTITINDVKQQFNDLHFNGQMKVFF